MGTRGPRGGFGFALREAGALVGCGQSGEGTDSCSQASSGHGGSKGGSRGPGWR